MEVQPELRRLVVTEGLTEDAIHSRLYEGVRVVLAGFC